MTTMNDRYYKTCLTTIAVLLGLLVVGLYAHLPVGLSTAEAQQYAPQDRPSGSILPDSALQREVMITELRAINSKLSEINRTLTSGQVKVLVVEAENKNEGTHVLPPRTK